MAERLSPDVVRRLEAALDLYADPRVTLQALGPEHFDAIHALLADWRRLRRLIGASDPQPMVEGMGMTATEKALADEALAIRDEEGR